MHYARAGHTASLLTNGKVLVAGGTSNGFTGLNSTELYHPSTGTWKTVSSVNHARCFHTSSLLANGKVLVTSDYISLIV